MMHLSELLGLASYLERYAIHCRRSGDAISAGQAESLWCVVMEKAKRLEQIAAMAEKIAENI